MSISERWKKFKEKMRELFFIGVLDVEDFDVNENEQGQPLKDVQLVQGEDYDIKGNRVIEDKTFYYDGENNKPYKVTTRIRLPENYQQDFNRSKSKNNRSKNNRDEGRGNI